MPLYHRIFHLTSVKNKAQSCAVPADPSLALFLDGLSTGIFGNPGYPPPVSEFYLCALPVRRRRITMNKQDPNSWKKLPQKSVSRRNLIRGAAAAGPASATLRSRP